MHRIIFTIIIGIIVNSHVLAGTYSDAVALQSKCEIAGNLSKSFYGKKQDELRTSAADLKKQMKSKKISEKTGGDMQYLIWMGYSAQSAQDAYMAGWGWCMDQK